MKVYSACRNAQHELIVTVNSQPLNPRFDLRNHSPDGFECGYCGSGPAQLALALFADCVGNEAALDSYQAFKWAVVATLPKDEWTLTSDGIQQKLVALDSKIRPL